MPNANGELITRFQMSYHVQELCAEHGILVEFTANAPATGYHAVRSPRKIRIRPTKNTGWYVSALHEIGHIIGKHQTNSDDQKAQEFWAWVWAKKNALTWTDTAERIMWEAMNSYGISRDSVSESNLTLIDILQAPELEDA
tara:strand:- start:378 stop:800 length:423 start_codon:yes stop_codon:yes gene_type:complete